jgi:hypothetical protein
MQAKICDPQEDHQVLESVDGTLWTRLPLVLYLLWNIKLPVCFVKFMEEQLKLEVDNLLKKQATLKQQGRGQGGESENLVRLREEWRSIEKRTVIEGGGGGRETRDLGVQETVRESVFERQHEGEKSRLVGQIREVEQKLAAARKQLQGWAAQRTPEKVHRAEASPVFQGRTKDVVVWKASCGCFRAAQLQAKGVPKASLTAEQVCGGDCTGEACYCHPEACSVCRNPEACSVCRKAEQKRMLNVTKKVVQGISESRRLMLFTEAPLAIKEKRALVSRTMYVDCLVVVDPGQHEVKFGDCMLALEFDGTTHTNPWSRHGSKEAGRIYQKKSDEDKDMVVLQHDIKMLRWSEANMSAEIWETLLTKELHELPCLKTM